MERLKDMISKGDDNSEEMMLDMRKRLKELEDHLGLLKRETPEIIDELKITHKEAPVVEEPESEEDDFEDGYDNDHIEINTDKEEEKKEKGFLESLGDEDEDENTGEEPEKKATTIEDDFKSFE